MGYTVSEQFGFDLTCILNTYRGANTWTAISYFETIKYEARTDRKDQVLRMFVIQIVRLRIDTAGNFVSLQYGSPATGAG